MSDTQQYDFVVSAARQEERRRQSAVSNMRYSPWGLGAYLALACCLIVGPLALGASLNSIGQPGAVIGFLVAVATYPVGCVLAIWTAKAALVELDRLTAERRQFDPPADPEPAGPMDPGVNLTPGYALNGELVAPTIEDSAEVAELRAKCLRFVRGGMRRGSWSRSKLAEGANKWMSGDDWDAASHELQRLGYFESSPRGMKPVRDMDDILGRLELAR